MGKDKENLRAQVKSRFYYLFWGIATISVVSGQILVASGYNKFANTLDRLFDTIEIQIDDPIKYY